MPSLFRRLALLCALTLLVAANQAAFANDHAKTQGAQGFNYDRSPHYPAVEGYHLTLLGNYRYFDPPQRTADDSAMESLYGQADITVPFDFGLTESHFLSGFGWQFSANALQQLDNDGFSYRVQATPFWRMPNLGEVGVTFGVSETFPDGASSQTTDIYGAHAALYLFGHFTPSLEAVHFDNSSAETSLFRGRLDIYPIDDVKLTGVVTRVDVGLKNGGRDLGYFSVSYQAEWQAFSYSNVGLSLFVGGSNDFGDNKGSYEVRSGFRLFLGTHGGSLKHRDRHH